MKHVDLKLFTHELVEGTNPDFPDGSYLVHHELNISVPEEVASDVVRIFHDNPTGNTSVHEDTLALYPVPV